MNHGVQIRICGKVQGVGFRPFVWQLAQQHGRLGDVCNDSEGVLLRLLGNEAGFIAALFQHCPPLARIDNTQIMSFTWSDPPTAFVIRESGAGAMSTQIVPDAATCPACLAEMNDPQERRYHYPFINCTHCGPRFTIIHAMPYDRPLTVMAAFPLCPQCEAEYRNPYDRRFHAQPVACAECGPALSWQSGEQRAEQEEALAAAISLLDVGGIVAIKGLGGFHLACDATNPQAVALLRERKHRPAKPLAVMLPNAELVSQPARLLLQTPAAPIVLVDKSQIKNLCDAIAPDLNEVGVMLPANPIQHLIMQALNRPLVMTSGNFSGKPPALTNDQALADLINIADGFLLHNRDILQRMDDSVVRENGEMLRRSRGFVPDAIPLPPGFVDVPPMLCLGADMKNTFSLVRGDQVVLSQHFGDLSDEGVEVQWQKALRVMQSIYDFTPQAVVTDHHEGYRSVQWASASHLPVQRVLHHHAHIAACLAEHDWPLDGGDVIAMALDGIGMGENGALWGGECLRVNYREYQHLGGLPAVALPGGDLAARQPWRNLLAHCLASVPDWTMFVETQRLQQKNWLLLARAIDRGLNSPVASSCGRLFDAVAYAVGCAPETLSYEGEAACRLEALASTCKGVIHSVMMPIHNNQFDLSAFWQSWFSWQGTPAEKAWIFHDVLAQGVAALMRHHAELLAISTLAFGGGVLHNQLLRARLTHYLHHFTLLFPHRLPAGDGAISYGQAVISAARSRI